MTSEPYDLRQMDQQSESWMQPTALGLIALPSTARGQIQAAGSREHTTKSILEERTVLRISRRHASCGCMSEIDNACHGED